MFVQLTVIENRQWAGLCGERWTVFHHEGGEAALGNISGGERTGSGAGWELDTDPGTEG